MTTYTHPVTGESCAWIPQVSRREIDEIGEAEAWALSALRLQTATGSVTNCPVCGRPIESGQDTVTVGMARFHRGCHRTAPARPARSAHEVGCATQSGVHCDCRTR